MQWREFCPKKYKINPALLRLVTTNNTSLGYLAQFIVSGCDHS